MTPEQSSGPDLASDARPMVGTDRGNMPLWVGLLVVALLAVGLFILLEGRRQKQSEPPVRAGVADDAIVQPYQPPPLALPAVTDQAPPAATPPAREMATNVVTQVPQPRPSQPDYVLQPAQQPVYQQPAYQQPTAQPAPPPAAASNASVIVYDVSSADAPQAPAGTAGTAATNAGAKPVTITYASRGRASRLITIVPRGTLIPAVLETALDSTQPGQARALISEDVYNLNGDRVLIPRGSRLYGEYRADLAPGQKRAFVQWTELMRPDGAIIAIESPATDPLGRAGVRGKVNNHFPGRLGAALLQSAIDFGTLAAAQSLSNSSVIIAGSALQGATSQLAGPPAKPTLSVRQGAKISVLVSRDLEFAPVESVP